MRQSEYEEKIPDYLDGALSPDARVEFERQMQGDRGLAQQVSMLMYWQEALRAEGVRLQESGQPASGSLDRVWERCSRELHFETCWSALEATMLIKSLMRPICGLGTIEKTLTYARGKTDGSFHDLLRHWSAAVASICGSTTGELVLSAGMRMVGEAAG